MFGLRTVSESMVRGGTGTGRSTGGTTGGGSSGGSSGGIPLEILQRVAFEGLDPFSTEGQDRAYELMGPAGVIAQLRAVYGNSVIQLGNDYWYKGADGNSHKIVVDNPKTGGGSGTRLNSDDPRYWEDKDRQFLLDQQNAADANRRADQTLASNDRNAAAQNRYNYASLNAENQRAADSLAARYQEMGMTADNAKRAAVASVVDSQNSLAGQTANTSANVAKTAADYAANPRDAYAEAYYANQVGGVTPFGNLGNSSFGEYGKTLAEKAARIFQPVSEDLAASRARRDANPLSQLNIGPSAVRPAPPVSTTPVAPPAAADPWAQLRGYTPAQNQELVAYANRMKPRSALPPGFDPSWIVDGGLTQQGADYRNFVTGGSARSKVGDLVPGYAKGGQIDIGNMTRFGGDQPSSSEGGTNMNIHEPAHVVGIHSGRVYATLAENGYPEQLIIKPTPSGKKAAMEAEKAGKEQKDVMGKAFGTGGTVAATPDELLQQYQIMLSRLTGEHGGGGSSDPFGGTGQVAGTLADEAMRNPRVRNALESTYSAKGVSPEQLWADVARFTPTDAGRQNIPRVNFA